MTDQSDLQSVFENYKLLYLS